MTSLWRAFAASWKHLIRNVWIGLATIFVLVLALLSVNLLLGLNVMAARVAVLLQDRIDVTVTFKADTPLEVLNQARFYLSSLPQVKDVKFVTAEEALRAFKATHASEADVLGALDEVAVNPLGAQLVIKAKQPEDYPFLMEVVKNPQYAAFVEKPTYEDYRDAIAAVEQTAARVRLFGSFLIAVFALFGLLITFHAIRVAIYAQREEIAIMRLVGASSWYIRTPFILEGLWLSVCSLVVSAICVWGLVTWAETALRPWFGGADTGLAAFFLTHWPLVVAFETLSLTLSVTFVSWIAVGRYLRR